MKLKSFLLVCGLSLAVALGGCGSANDSEANKATQTTVNTDSESDNDTTNTEAETNNDAQPETNNDDQSETTPEVDAKTKALQAYQEILKSAPALVGEIPELYDLTFNFEANREKFGDHYDSFALVDLNNDGIPELITSTIINVRRNIVNVFTYADDEAVLMANTVRDDFIVTFDQNSGANGAYLTFVCEKNHIHNYWHGTDPMGEPVDENYAYSLVGKELVEVECSFSESGAVTYFSDIAKVNSIENADAITR